MIGLKGSLFEGFKAPIDNMILNYISLIKCAAAQLWVENNRTRNNYSNSDIQWLFSARPGQAKIIAI